MMRSLRIRLLVLIGVAIAAVAALQFAVSFHAAMSQANKLFDYHMQQMAFALQDSSFELNEWRRFATVNNERFEFAIQVWDDDGVRVYQSRQFRALPKQAEPGFSTVALGNGDWRVYAVRNGSGQIQVAQRMEARLERAMSLALHALWPVLAASLLLFVAAWWVVTAALQPLNRIGNELANRNADSLSSISDAGVPEEVSLLVAELNLLLGRMRLALDSQQRFVADAAHELRTPLTALKLQVQTLARMKDETARAQAVERLLGGVDRASRLIEQLLALARQDPFANPVEAGSVCLFACLEEAMAELQPYAASRRIELHGEGLDSARTAEVRGNADSLMILLRNLLDNAIRYTPEGGEVRAGIHLEGVAPQARAVVTVEDSGPGIPDADRLRIFDRFYRVPGTDRPGSGLGLSIVRTIAQRHGAIIELGRSSLGGLSVKVSFLSSATSHTPAALETA